MNTLGKSPVAVIASRCQSPRNRAFTLIEMLVVVAIIGILASLLLPVLQGAKAKSKRIQCVSNLHQLGIAFNIFMHDHDSKFPMQTSTNDGGTLEYVNASYLIPNQFYFQYRHFQALSNDLASPAVLICPTDRDRMAATDFQYFNDFNISYFVGANADFAQPNSILAGDRNITNAAEGNATIIRLSDGTTVNWTSAMHIFKGNLLFADGRVDELNAMGLRLASAQTPSMMDLVTPSVSSSGLTPGSAAGANSAANANYPPLNPPPGFPAGGGAVASRPSVHSSPAAPGGGPRHLPPSVPFYPGAPSMGAAPAAPAQVVNNVNTTVVNPPAIVRTTKPAPEPAPAQIVTVTNTIPAEDPAPVILASTPPVVTPHTSHWPWLLLLLIIILLLTVEIVRLRLKRQSALAPQSPSQPGRGRTPFDR